MKKTTIFLIIFAVLALGGLWAYSQYYPKTNTPSENQNSSGQENPSEIPYENGIVVGDPNAPVIVFEHLSYLCGHCLDFAKNKLPELKKKYVNTGQVQWRIFVHPPVELSSAALCAVDQGKFKEFDSYFINNITDLKTADDIKIMAKAAGLDMKKFNACFNNFKFKNTVKAWEAKAQKAGINSTPTFFIGEEKILGNQPLSVFENAISKALN